MNPASTASSRALQYLLFAVALLPFYLLPLWAGVFYNEFKFSGSQLGLLLAADMALGTLASLLARTWIHRWQWKPVLVGAILITSLSNLACVTTTAYTGLLMLRCLAGFGAGTMMAFPYASLSSCENPDREFSLALALQVCLGAVALLLVARLDPSGSEGMGFYLCAAGALLPIFLLTSCPARNPAVGAEADTAAAEQPLSMFLVLALGAVCLFFTALTAIWIFMERLGNEVGIGSSLVTSILALGLLFSFAGAVTPSLAIAFTSRKTLVVIAYACLLLSVMGTGLSSLALVFAVSIIIYNFFYSFMIPLQTAWIAETDHTGRNAVLVPVAQGVGVTAGPVLAGTVSARWQGTGVIIFSLLVLAASLACYLLAARSPARDSG